MISDETTCCFWCAQLVFMIADLLFNRFMVWHHFMVQKAYFAGFLLSLIIPKPSAVLFYFSCHMNVVAFSSITFQPGKIYIPVRCAYKGIFLVL